ncbi:MAG: Uma2 family endonuclease [Planctomycetaceae bacterium]|nr:Uma2 family endonuclease [Planctomycetaceae bacterium]
MSAGFLVASDECEVAVPSQAMAGLEAFRRWALSEECPDSGRFDYIAGNIEVSDMAGEEVIAHGAVKMELARGIANHVRRYDLGYAFTDSVRVSSPEVGLSAEPDVIVVTFDAIESGRARLVPKAGAEQGRFIEVEGAPDLIIEVVSDSTVRKDTIRLPRSYFDAGVTEFWIADGRKKELTFVVHTRGTSGFEPVVPDQQGFQVSEVLGVAVRFERCHDRLGTWQYDLVSK